VPPTPSTTLLSAHEAKERLRAIVEGFFFRRLRTEDGKPIRRLLVKSPPGLGKTRQAIDWTIRYRAEQGKGLRRLLSDLNEAGVPAQTSIFVPRHQLAVEVKNVIERACCERGELITMPILRGRENGGEEGNAPCRAVARGTRAGAQRAPHLHQSMPAHGRSSGVPVPLFCRVRVHPTEKAAERWLSKNPLNPDVSIIRLWGVLADYRRSGRHRRWSKALVRHGADGRLALAAVLGLPAEDIRVRGRAG
jgi:hypothetical protein